MELFHRRPISMEGRLDKEIACFDLLDNLGIVYDGADHQIIMTMEGCAEIDDLLQVATCKNLFLCNRQKTNFYLLMIDGNKALQTKELSKQLGVARLSFAGYEFMEEFLNITPGSVSVMGLMNDVDNRVQLVVDQSVLDHTYVGCHPCLNTCTLKFATADLMEKVLPAMHHTPIVVDLP